MAAKIHNIIEYNKLNQVEKDFFRAYINSWDKFFDGFKKDERYEIMIEKGAFVFVKELNHYTKNIEAEINQIKETLENHNILINKNKEVYLDHENRLVTINNKIDSMQSNNNVFGGNKSANTNK